MKHKSGRTHVSSSITHSLPRRHTHTDTQIKQDFYEGHLKCIEENLNCLLQLSGQRYPIILLCFLPVTVSHVAQSLSGKTTQTVYVIESHRQVQREKQYKKSSKQKQGCWSAPAAVFKPRSRTEAAAGTCESWGRCTPPSVECKGCS